jgi:MFS family permease
VASQLAHRECYQRFDHPDGVGSSGQEPGHSWTTDPRTGSPGNTATLAPNALFRVGEHTLQPSRSRSLAIADASLSQLRDLATPSELRCAVANTEPQQPRAVVAAWSPLGVPAFRTVWIAVLITNIGGWMASVATAWLMTSLDPSPLMVSLVSAATSLPLFLFALPAGALADIVDRRKLLLFAQFFMLALVIVLLLLTMTGLITPLALLIVIFLIAMGTAFETPAFLAVLPELVPKPRLQPALALNSVGINISRIVRPALGGVIVGAAGVAAALALNAATFAAVIFAYARLPPTQPETCLPAERLWGAIRTGWRFTRQSPELKATLVRAAAFFLFASAYLALLPLIARNQLGSRATGFGFLFACHGGGAVLGALLLPFVQERLSGDQLVLGGGVLTAAMTALLATAHHIAVAVPILLVTGAGSLAIMSTLMLSAQVALPPWVKARGLAVVQMLFSGALTAGSLLWGSDRVGVPMTRVIAAAGLAGASVLTLRWRLPARGPEDYRPSDHWPAPVVVGSVLHGRGPVMVTIEYRIDPAQRTAFAEVLERVGRVRRRDGALLWEHFADTANPARHIEVFIAESWLEHLRQHERVTVADRALEDELRRFHVGDKAPVVTHLISARTNR